MMMMMMITLFYVASSFNDSLATVGWVVDSVAFGAQVVDWR